MGKKEAAFMRKSWQSKAMGEKEAAFMRKSWQSKAMREKEAAFMRKSWQSKAMGEKEAEFESVCQCSMAEGSCSMCGRRLWDSHSFQQHEGSCPKKVAKP